MPGILIFVHLCEMKIIIKIQRKIESSLIQRPSI